MDDATPQACLTEIPSLAHLAVTGVYMLYFEGEIVYVGQAVDVRRRIGQHITESVKRFDAVSVVPCLSNQLNKLERFFIVKHAPRYNRCNLTMSVRAGGICQPKEAPSHGRLLTPAQAAEIIGVSEQVMWAWRKDGIGPSGRRMPRSKAVRYLESEVRAFRK